jgi:hypothetical protein
VASLWRRTFDAIERPLAAGMEAWVQSDTFMDLASVAFRVQRRMLREAHRVGEDWLHIWGLSSHADVTRMMSQVGRLERQLRDLRHELRNGAPAEQLARAEELTPAEQLSEKSTETAA